MTKQKQTTQKHIIILTALIIGIALIGHAEVLAKKDFEQTTITFHAPRQLPQNEDRKDLSVEENYYNKIRTDKDFRAYIENMEVKCNNPGNLVFANQPNAWKEGRFACYNNSTLGFRGLLMQLKLDQSRDKTLAEFVEIYAPRFENDTDRYIAFISELTGFKKHDNIKNIDTIELAKAVTKQEHSY